MGQEHSQQQPDLGDGVYINRNSTFSRRGRSASIPARPSSSKVMDPAPIHLNYNTSMAVEAPVGHTPTLSPHQTPPSLSRSRNQSQGLLRNNSTALSRSATISSVSYSTHSIMSNASVSAAGSASAASNPVTAFSISLATCKWVFTKTATHQQVQPSVSHLTDSAWSHESIHSNSIAENSSPMGLLSLNLNTATCVLIHADTSEKDGRRQLEASFTWKPTVQAQINSRASLLPLSQSELDSLSTKQHFQNAFLSFLDALTDALSEISNLEYNADLSDQYESPTTQPPTSSDTASIFSTAHDTLAQGLILTPRELKLLEYSVKKKVAVLCGIVSVLGASASCILVRIGYEPRACNEVELRKADWVSLWYVFDDEFGYGLNKTNGQIGFINLGHLDKRRLSMATQAPPLPTLAIPPQLPKPQKQMSGSPTVPLPSFANSASSRYYIPNNNNSSGSYNPATSVSTSPPSSMSASQHRMSVLLQMSASASQQPFSPPSPTSKPRVASSGQYVQQSPVVRASTLRPALSSGGAPTSSTPPINPLFSVSQKSLSINSTSTHNTSIQVSTLSTPHLRISDRLVSRAMLADTDSQIQMQQQHQQQRYNYLESELESLLSASDGYVSGRGMQQPQEPQPQPSHRSRASDLSSGTGGINAASRRSSSVPSGGGVTVSGAGRSVARSPRRESLIQKPKESGGARDSLDSSLLTAGSVAGGIPGSVAVAAAVIVTPYSMFAAPPPPPSEDVQSFVDDYI
ncbi:hypothetical protein HDU81_006747 [Chytriomyces hyalinus]|nr:hypothetical protein HDU81_006747 [Chytriomyces hyalinus]